jgi:hypothetical protein
VRNETRNYQSFTLHRADNLLQFAYSMARFEKITAGRYRGWSLAISKKFEEYVDKLLRQRRRCAGALAAFEHDGISRCRQSPRFGETGCDAGHRKFPRQAL